MGRHALWQGAKFRPIDNGRASGTNSMYMSKEAIVVPRADCPATIGRAFYARAVEEGWVEECDLGGGADDEPDAFRHSATREPGLTVSSVVDPETGEVRYFVHPAPLYEFTTSVLLFAEVVRQFPQRQLEVNAATTTWAMD